VKIRNIKPVQALCFDLDGTLVDGNRFDNAIRRTCTQLAEATGLDAGTLFDANKK
jgi:phosphoglycolate phosphatase-like HAD superfamily hydrolase